MDAPFSVPVAPSDAVFESVPPPVRAVLASGFSSLAGLTGDSLDKVADQVSLWLDPTTAAPKNEDIARDLDIEASAAHAILMAAMFQASALFGGMNAVSVDAFVAKAVSADILHEQQSDAIRSFGKDRLDTRRTTIQRALARSYSSVHIMPSFQSLDATIDLRVATVDGGRPVLMPMAIAALRTDVRDRELVFQMTPRDVEQLVQQLRVLADRLASFKAFDQPTSDVP